MSQIPVTTSHTIIFPYDEVLNKYSFDFYFEMLSGNRLSIDQVTTLFCNINRICGKKSCKKGSSIFACSSTKKSENIRSRLDSLDCIISTLNKDLACKKMKLVIPEDGYPSRLPKWIELIKEPDLNLIHINASNENCCKILSKKLTPKYTQNSSDETSSATNSPNCSTESM